MNVVSRREARAKGLTRYFTGKPCKRRHVAERDTPNGTCVECSLGWKRRNAEHVRQYSRDYHLKNRDDRLEKSREYFQTEAGKDTKKRSHEKHKEKRNYEAREWRRDNPEKNAQARRAWYEKNGLARHHERYQNDLSYKLASQLRCRLKMAIREDRKVKVGSAVKDLGCSLETFRDHLERQFSPNMTWQNFGIEWELDHIAPLGLFDLTDRRHLLEACHYTNIQPLSVPDHKRKTVYDVAAIRATRRKVCQQSPLI